MMNTKKEDKSKTSTTFEIFSKNSDSMKAPDMSSIKNQIKKQEKSEKKE